MNSINGLQQLNLLVGSYRFLLVRFMLQQPSLCFLKCNGQQASMEIYPSDQAVQLKHGYELHENVIDLGFILKPNEINNIKPIN